MLEKEATYIRSLGMRAKMVVQPCSDQWKSITILTDSVHKFVWYKDANLMFSATTGNINFMLLRLGTKCLCTNTLLVMI